MRLQFVGTFIVGFAIEWQSLKKNLPFTGNTPFAKRMFFEGETGEFG